MTVLSLLEQDLESGRPVLLDGATGTELERRGAPMHDAAWCAMATLTSTDILRTVHEDYIRAGARIITTNTFSTNRLMLEPAGLGDRFEELNRTAVATAMQARENTGAAERVVVAGSMSHQVPIVAGSDQRRGYVLPDGATAKQCFTEMAAILADGGVDLILMEMMSDPELANPAIEAAMATGLPVWVGVSVRGSDDDRPVAYSRPALSVREMLDAIAFEDAGVVGVMHSKVNLIDESLDALRERWSGPLMVYPDSGHFTMPNWQFVDVMPADEFARQGRRWIAGGTSVVGGCCGLGLEHIAALAAAVEFA